MYTIEQVSGLEILDSRGRPTVKAKCRLKSGVEAQCSVPSGASTGAAETLELRDGDLSRYGGLGCRRAVRNIRETINKALAGRTFHTQSDLDTALIDLDGTPNKSHLGANAILAVSLAFARAAATQRGVPLYRYFAEILGAELRTLPRLTVNLFSGGKHAGGQSPIQDVLVVPVSSRTVGESLEMVYAVYQAAARLSLRKYGMRALTADEGGLAPPFAEAEAMLEDAIASIVDAGLKPGIDVGLAVDAASSHFFADGRYRLDDRPLSGAEMIDLLVRWKESYPVVSIEDGLAEDDWEHWPMLRAALEPDTLIVGDDLLCTNPARIRRAIESKAANTLLLKVNQIGSLTEAMEACQMARTAGWNVTASARSGETEDDWLADLAVGWAGDQIKVGSITRSERLSKYNRLLEIETETPLPLVTWPAGS